MARYLIAQYTRGAVPLFLVTVFLVWIMQVLTLFDLVTAKGQDLLTLMLQSALLTPPLSRAILSMAMGIGIARAFAGLQKSHELHTIHATNRIGAQWSALIVFVLAGTLIVSLTAHWLEPKARLTYARWSEEVVADLLANALDPHRFYQISDGLTVAIGGRQPNGSFVDFFADDARDPAVRRSYQAASAIVVPDEQGYFLSLRNGSVQQLQSDGSFSEVRFASYELTIDKLAGSAASTRDSERSSLELFDDWQAGTLGKNGRKMLDLRLSESLRLLALCLVVAALTGFPSARRHPGRIPVEVKVLAIALFERLVAEVLAAALPFGYTVSALLLLASGVLLMAYRLFGSRFFALREVPA